ncbi:PTS system sucrose-specific IIA component, Glc family /PTS system sucrose-specific IIB component, Glc family /PTS system sucrose-specific IIC component, Glc family [Acetitomaculum ruminis DSM 5522]|uniref:PTS system sucrose-specific IIA component, Glc family /PTS system sucrose-specific IIB component, Glc family /PTS system sucrose-specific IIC component, Glc family n=1 Tax=Acetitomaculum ruminis DSM 5522 TaxID=1120918 RepID=A0A1I0YT32_9FIRM|nr:PTS beta-glucoside transporter subunit IIBCA [Acetitomaculum ruminis]SFB16545.1 PTS system sucrose-specific IIA component, Glc family /PTS system sucrose-specific IIB component, Glc family /PTS system sucrose-specific IIC component, Glc family [Acetitomaculum ruminis DSM 5522]
MDYRESAKAVIEAIGGKDNIVSAAHCATRLRLVIADNSKVNISRVENVEGVKGCFEAAGQLQVIYGTGIVNKVYDEFIKLAGIEGGSKEDLKAAAAQKQNVFFRAIKTLGDIFVPIIPAIVASGLLNGLLGGLSAAYPDIAKSSVYEIINLFAGAALSMLPILIAVSAAKKFDGNPYLAAVIGFIMIHPSLINAWSVASMEEAGETIPTWSVWFGAFDINQVGYQGHVIPVIIAIFVMSWIEKRLHKIVPAMLDLFVTPLVTVLVTGYLTLSAIGPVFSKVEGWVLTAAQSLISLPFGLGGVIIGGLYAITVVAGLHHMYNMIEAEMCSLAVPMNTWMPIATAANVGQGAAALAVGVKSKNKKIKSMALPASLSAFLGITEPAIFGVNVRFMKPFVAGCIGGAAGGIVASLTGIYANAYGITGLFGFLITAQFVGYYAMVMVVSFAVAFIVSFVMYKDPVEETENATTTLKSPSNDSNANTSESASFEETIYNPIKGRVIPLEDVPDQTFAQKTLGDGMAIIPGEGKVVSPVDGVVETLFETKHAIGITTDNDVEILIHIGLNTVELNGQYFESHVSEGDKVKKGQLLISFDMNKIKDAGYNTVTPIIITNIEDFEGIEKETSGNKDTTDKLMKVY